VAPPAPRGYLSMMRALRVTLPCAKGGASAHLRRAVSVSHRSRPPGPGSRAREWSRKRSGGPLGTRFRGPRGAGTGLREAEAEERPALAHAPCHGLSRPRSSRCAAGVADSRREGWDRGRPEEMRERQLRPTEPRGRAGLRSASSGAAPRPRRPSVEQGERGHLGRGYNPGHARGTRSGHADAVNQTEGLGCSITNGTRAGAMPAIRGAPCESGGSSSGQT